MGQAQAREIKSLLQGSPSLITAEMPTPQEVKCKVEDECTGLDSETVRFGGVFLFYFEVYMGHILHKRKG